MNGDVDLRFRRWLTDRAPEAAPADLVARSMTALDHSPAQQWRWPRFSLAFASAGVAVVAIAALLVGMLGLLPPSLPMIGDASASPTVVVSASPGTVPTVDPWTFEPSSSAPGSSETPGATDPAASALPPTVAPPTPRPIYTGGPMTVVTFRLVLTWVPLDATSLEVSVSGLSTPPFIDGLTDLNSATFCGGADRPAHCVPGTYERRATFPAWMVPNLEWFFVEVTPAGPVPVLVLHGFVPSDGLVVMHYPSATPNPSATPAPPAGFSCDAPAGQWVGIELRVWEPTYVSADDVCIVRIEVQSTDPHPTSGSVIVTVDGAVAWTMDLSLWDSTGTQGTLSTQRIISVDPAIKVAKGQVLGLGFSGCDEACASSLDVFPTGRQP